MDIRIANDNCAMRLEIFKQMLESLCKACGVTLNLHDIDGCIAVRDATAEVDPDWPCVATFTGVADDSTPGLPKLTGCLDWELSTKPAPVTFDHKPMAQALPVSVETFRKPVGWAREPMFLVINETDGISASPDPMTAAQAEEFMDAFEDRFKQQGYYLTARGERIPPEDVVLTLEPVE